MKFTPEGGKIKISGKMTEKSETGYGRFKFKINISGLNIDDEYINNILSRVDKDEGRNITELTLARTRNIVNAMGGSIEAGNKKCSGTTIYFFLPLKLSGSFREHGDDLLEQIRTSNMERAKGRVLVVEDSDEIRRVLKEIITESGYSVEILSDGCDAVEAFRAHEPYYYDIILTDIQMPVMTGYEEIRVIRHMGHRDSKTIPVYALSSDKLKEDKLKAAESGATGHIATPVDPNEIRTIINMVCN
jgi:CheY-like chemotaxis protein